MPVTSCSALSLCRLCRRAQCSGRGGRTCVAYHYFRRRMRAAHRYRTCPSISGVPRAATLTDIVAGGQHLAIATSTIGPNCHPNAIRSNFETSTYGRAATQTLVHGALRTRVWVVIVRSCACSRLRKGQGSDLDCPPWRRTACCIYGCILY